MNDQMGHWMAVPYECGLLGCLIIVITKLQCLQKWNYCLKGLSARHLATCSARDPWRPLADDMWFVSLPQPHLLGLVRSSLTTLSAAPATSTTTSTVATTTSASRQHRSSCISRAGLFGLVFAVPPASQRAAAKFLLGHSLSRGGLCVQLRYYWPAQAVGFAEVASPVTWSWIVINSRFIIGFSISHSPFFSVRLFPLSLSLALCPPSRCLSVQSLCKR